MESQKIYENLSLVSKRSHRVFIVVKILLLFLIVFFWKVQIIDHKKFWKQSEANRIREVILSAPRGLIVSREGKVLADNIASFKASIIREDCSNMDLSFKRASRLLDLEEDVLRRRIRRYESMPLFKPIVVKDNLNLEEVSLIEGRKLEFPELILQAEPKRFYPYREFAAHLLGYLQELSEKEIKSGIYQERRLGDLIGKTGIEKKYDSLLRGTDAQSYQVVDSTGRIIKDMISREPVPGYNLTLTLDFELQKKAEDLLQGKEGAIVILDPRNGEILAMVSYPSFDPNKFINRFSPEEWMDLINNPDFPLENRAIRGLYAPGSVFKLTIALAALDLKLITENSVFFCRGRIRIYGHPFSCWYKPGHGPMNLVQAIKNSCNIYFYNLGKKLDIEEIADYASILGFGAKTGVDLPDEKKGLVPTPEWKKKGSGLPWYPGETISVSIGQGPLLVTPLQIAVHTAIIANRGKKVIPHLIRSYFDPMVKKEKAFQYSSNEPVTKINTSTYEKIIRGMWMAVNKQGTARLAMIEGFDVCGKTGSTQVVSTVRGDKTSKNRKKIKTHSWFTGFAPIDKPEVVITVLVEYGGLGGEGAAPLAKEMLALYQREND